MCITLVMHFWTTDCQCMQNLPPPLECRIKRFLDRWFKSPSRAYADFALEALGFSKPSNAAWCWRWMSAQVAYS